MVDNLNMTRERIRKRRKHWIERMESNSIYKRETERSIDKSHLYHSYHIRDEISPIYDTPAKVEYREEKTNETIMHICDEVSNYDSSPETKIAVLNFASYKRPGGGFLTGTGTAQEESLCEVSNLALILENFIDEYRERKANYGLYSNDCIYSPDVLFRDKGRKCILRRCDVISISAPNYIVYTSKGNDLSVGNKYGTTSIHHHLEYLDAIDTRIQTIFDIAVDNKVDVLVLGAFGCGIFGNKPTLVAETMFKLVKIYEKNFKKIIFTIPYNPKVTPAFKLYYKLYKEGKGEEL